MTFLLAHDLFVTCTWIVNFFPITLPWLVSKKFQECFKEVSGKFKSVSRVLQLREHSSITSSGFHTFWTPHHSPESSRSSQVFTPLNWWCNTWMRVREGLKQVRGTTRSVTSYKRGQNYKISLNLIICFISSPHLTESQNIFHHLVPFGIICYHLVTSGTIR